MELDGSQHADVDAMTYDARRTAWLERAGWHVLRFDNADVLDDLDAVCAHIEMVVR